MQMWKIVAMNFVQQSQAMTEEKKQAALMFAACFEKEKRKRINYCPWVDCPQKLILP